MEFQRSKGVEILGQHVQLQLDMSQPLTPRSLVMPFM